jgi:hypothetical protein
MKPRNREVTIFNMSVLDLLTGALGAFCFLTLALFPSYYSAQKEASPATPSDTAKKEAGKPTAEVKGLAGPVPPFSVLYLGAAPPGETTLCAGLEVTTASSESGGDLAPFPGTEISPGSHGDFYLFALHAGAFHLALRATPIHMPCEVTLTLQNPNNNWEKKEQIKDAQHPVEFDFNILSSDLNSDLWSNG